MIWSLIPDTGGGSDPNAIQLGAGFLSGVGGVAGVLVSVLVGLLIGLLAPGFSAVPPAWAVAAGIGASVLTGLPSAISYRQGHFLAARQ